MLFAPPRRTRRSPKTDRPKPIIAVAILGVFVVFAVLETTYPFPNQMANESTKNRFDLPDELPDDIIQGLDAILVLGGGVPVSIDEPPVFVQKRCDDAAKIVERYRTSNNKGNNNHLPILTLSAGTAHLPQLLSPDGLPIWESTASAAYLIKQFPNVIDPTQLFVETTSYDTISNAFFARTSFTDISGWRRLLIITNEFHMDRSQAIFEWIFGLENKKGNAYQLYYLATPNVGLTEEAVQARKEREAKSQKTVETILAPKYQTMKAVWTFLTQDHALYTAQKLVERGRTPAEAVEEGSKALKESYGLKK